MRRRMKREREEVEVKNNEERAERVREREAKKTCSAPSNLMKEFLFYTSSSAAAPRALHSLALSVCLSARSLALEFRLLLVLGSSFAPESSGAIIINFASACVAMRCCARPPRRRRRWMQPDMQVSLVFTHTQFYMCAGENLIFLLVPKRERVRV